jgi:hypothetical protein
LHVLLLASLTVVICAHVLHRSTASAATAVCPYLHPLLLLLQAAAAKGYSSMVLETLEGLRGAVALYAKLGFTRTSSYCANPLLGELLLTALRFSK